MHLFEGRRGFVVREGRLWFPSSSSSSSGVFVSEEVKVRVPVCLRHAEVKRGEAELVRVAHRNGCGFDVV